MVIYIKDKLTVKSKKSKVKDLRLEANDFSLRLFRLKNRLRLRAMKVKTKGRSETWP